MTTQSPRGLWRTMKDVRQENTAGPVVSESPQIQTVEERLRRGLELIMERHKLRENDYGDRYPTEYSRAWSDGYITALATCSLIAQEYLDPVAWAEHQEEWELGSHGTDQEWFERTGHCGHCGNVAAYCACTSDDSCGCGPHELATEPLPCWRCNGTGFSLRVRSTKTATNSAT